jgi:hypothetical protein
MLATWLLTLVAGALGKSLWCSFSDVEVQRVLVHRLIMGCLCQCFHVGILSMVNAASSRTSMYQTGSYAVAQTSGVFDVLCAPQ